LAWSRDDALQDILVRKVFRRDIARLHHFVPTSEGFGAAVLAGLGWGMFPNSLAAPRLSDGSFARINKAHLDVPLYWQCWKLDSQIVQKLTGSVQAAADAILRKSR
jgi:LysR family transcriptional regulator (chromosome initiation inhibitor)